MNTILHIKDIVPLQDFAKFQDPLNWSISEKQHWAIIGPNGAGKTLFADIITGKYTVKSGEIICKDKLGNTKHHYNFIKLVSFRDIYSFTEVQNSYYQQRWNIGLEEDTTQVKELLKNNPDQKWIEQLISIFNISDLIEKNIRQLSSGELRKFLLLKSLSQKPEILILDNPFIGLDRESRKLLKETLKNIAHTHHLQIILIVSDIADIPSFINKILPVKNKVLLPSLSKEEFFSNEEIQNTLFLKKNINLSELENKEEKSPFEYALELKNIHIKYGKRTILKNLSWKVKKGEKWALLGANGSGKSTLLSLIAADNPQAYANDIILFDKKRGTGESIWDIKKHIGYISPEMHLYYLKNIPCHEVVSSGFFDTVGLYRKSNSEQEKIALQWMDILGIKHLKNTLFFNISTGEQRLVLLARVFVKNPSLIILDEPMHGLDSENKKRVKQIIEKFCTKEKSLIFVTHYKEEIPEIINQELVLFKND